MSTAFWIERATGTVCFDGGGRLAVGDVEEAVVGGTGRRDMGNGYVWLHLDGVSFGGMVAALALAFLHGRFCEASWSVSLPGEAEGWPTEDAMTREVAFVRHVLGAQVGLTAGRGAARFAWGEVWSGMDIKGGAASHGLRYGSRNWLARLLGIRPG